MNVLARATFGKAGRRASRGGSRGERGRRLGRGVALPAIALVWIVVVVAAARAARAQPVREQEAEMVRALAKPFVDQGWVRSLVVGVVDRSGPRVYGFGRVTADADAKGPDGRTVFEIASVTKTFTALLLAEMAGRGEVRLDDPVAKHLPPEVKVPATDAPMTLLALATHHSGLPRMPWNFRPASADNPYADYTVDKLYEYLPRAKPHATAEYEYSNVGYGLLGHALARAARPGGQSYEGLVKARLTDVLKMPDTTVGLSAEQRRRLAPPFDADLEPDANWDFAALPAGGALRSTADDMLRYAAAHAGLRADLPAGLAKAIEATRADRATGPGDAVRMAMGWHVSVRDGRLFHNGQTGGYHSFVSVDPKGRAGVVVLANTATMKVDVLGGAVARWVAGQAVRPIALPAPVRLDAAALDRLSGKYLLPDGSTMLVRRDGDRLITISRGNRAQRLYPKSPTEFFAKAADAVGTFELDPGGKVTGIAIRQDGKELRAKRTE